MWARQIPCKSLKIPLRKGQSLPWKGSVLFEMEKKNKGEMLRALASAKTLCLRFPRNPFAFSA